MSSKSSSCSEPPQPQPQPQTDSPLPSATLSIEELRAKFHRQPKEELIAYMKANNMFDVLKKAAPVRKRSRNDITPDDQTRQIATVALTRWNKNQKSTGAAEYVFVEPITSAVFYGPENQRWYHANFRARLKNDPSAEPEILFAEIKGNVWGTRKREVTNVCVVEPNDGSGLHFCKACGRGSPPLYHPEGGFNIGHRMGPLLA